MNGSIFHKCSCCNYIWYSLVSFLGDVAIELKGYQVHFKELKTGLFLFNHSCGGTMAIQVHHFSHLFDGTVFRDRLTDTEQCPGYCCYQEELRPCPAKCECAYVREIIQLIEKYDKITSAIES
ncbi:hypothetical protein ACFLSX_01305 [Calditrichota bacterium]